MTTELAGERLKNQKLSDLLDQKEKIIKELRELVIKRDMKSLELNESLKKVNEELKKEKVTNEEWKKVGKEYLNGTGTNKTEVKKLTAEFKKKMDDLNKQIMDQQRAKQKKEDQIKKTIAQQDTRIKIMEQELAKQKKANETLEIQKKYGEERYSKMRVQTGKDISNYKKTVADKEKTVYSLKNELKKTDAIVN